MSLIERIRAAGVEIAADGNRLLARGVMTPEQRAWLTDHKAELLAELRGARPMVEYRYADNEQWHLMLGRPGATFAD